jgi:glycosyltransferase involved in cell wall biosynthesis
MQKGKDAMRVAHFIQRYPPALGGAEAYFSRLSRHLVAAGENVSVFTSAALDLSAFWSKKAKSLPAGQAIEDGVLVRRYALWRLPGRRYLLKALSLVPYRPWQCLTLPCNPISWQMWRDAAMPQQPFDVVHASAFPYAWPIACGLRLARRLGVPFFLTPFLHLGDPTGRADSQRRAYTTPALMFLARQADVLFVQTPGERQALLDQGIPDERVVLQGLGVDPAECTGGDRAGARRSWHAAEDEIVIGHLANNSEEKGSVDLLRAVQQLWQRRFRIRLVLAGPAMPNFQRFWRSFEPAGPVLRLGVLTEQQKRDFFAGLDLFALPSRSDSFGLVLLEAWANGLANVGYRAGGIAEVVRHGLDGLLVPCGDVDGLATALGNLTANPELRCRLGSAGQQRAQQDLGWSGRLELVRNKYAEIANDLSQDFRSLRRLTGVFASKVG